MKPPMRLDAVRGVMFFLCAIVICFIVGSLLSMLILSKGATAGALRIATVIQDVVVFIIPAVATALIVTRYPARFLEIDRAPGVRMTLLAIAAMLAMVPAMNAVIAWNESLSLPASLASLEQQMKAAEENAAQLTATLMSGSGIGSLVISLLIVGVLAGFSEELFFRGTLQRLLTNGSGAPHAAIWVTALIFSAIHFQFYGFVPRLLLGAFFGYTLYWSGSVWVPVVLHVINNSIVVFTTWATAAGMKMLPVDDIGKSPSQWWAVVISVLVTAGLIYIISKQKPDEKA